MYTPLVMFNRKLAKFLFCLVEKGSYIRARFEVLKNFLIFNFWALSVNVN